MVEIWSYWKNKIYHTEIEFRLSIFWSLCTVHGILVLQSTTSIK